MENEPKEFTPEWFDWSSQMWLLNKKKKANATYVYLCECKDSKGKQCEKPKYKDKAYCWNHRRLF